MPMTWTPEAEAKLNGLLFLVCDIKPTKEQRAEIAARMGPDCTAKAVAHRLTHIRKALVTDCTSFKLTSVTPTHKRAPCKKRASAARTGKQASATQMGEKAATSEEPYDSETSDATQMGEKAATSEEPYDSDPSKTCMGKILPYIFIESSKRKVNPYAVFKDDKEIALGEDIGEGFRKRMKIVESIE